MGEFEGDDPGLEGAKRDRSRVEYYWTCTAPWLLWLFRNVPEADVVVYVDADVMFFGPPGGVLRELGEGSILLNLHDSSQEYGTGDRPGKFNVGVMAFRRDAKALAALSWWRERCIETCRYDPAAGLYGDQHYLNDWEARFRGVVVGRNPGLRAAPWNIARYRAAPDGPEGILLDGFPLVAYHFHSLAFCTRRLVWLAGWNAAIPEVVLERGYVPYLRELKRAEGDLLRHGRPIPLPVRGIPWRYIFGRILRRQPVKYFAVSREG
jgi:hypothetical protein